jgi:hypothetical protein
MIKFSGAPRVLLVRLILLTMGAVSRAGDHIFPDNLSLTAGGFRGTWIGIPEGSDAFCVDN